MPRIWQNLHKRAIGMLNAGATMNAVAKNTGCSTRAIQHLRQHFQVTRHTEDQPRSGCLRVITCGQDHYIWNTHRVLPKRFRTATATAANTRISDQMCSIPCARVG